MRVSAIDAWTPYLMAGSCLFWGACGSSHGLGTGAGAQTAGVGGGQSEAAGEGGANPGDGGSNAGDPSGGANSTGRAGAHTGGSGGGRGGGAGSSSGGTSANGGAAGVGGGAASGGAGGVPSAGSCDPLSCPDLGTCTLTHLANGCERTCVFDQPYQGASDADVARLAALRCTIIDGSLDFVRGSATSLVGLESIREITGSLTIDGGKLVDLKGLDGLQTAKTFTVQRLDIQSVVLPALKHVGQFTATDLLKLEVLRLPSLETADPGVMITTCGLITSVDLDALKSVTKELDISLNAELLTLNRLPALTSAPSLVMSINPKLPQCEVDAIVARLGSTTHCTCAANDANATCN